MADIARMYPSNVKQPWADVKKENPFPCCIKAVDRNGNYEGYNCANRSDPRYYHEWTNAMELTRGGEIQCGRPSNYYCNHKTYYQIGGYRNTCPIAGCSGTYFQPSLLQLELSQTHLQNYGIIDGTEIHNVEIHFNHRALGVNVANSNTTTAWGPNFCGFDKYPDLKVLKMYITDKNGNQKGNVVIHNENPPLKGYAGVNARFEGITYQDIVDGHINIEYQRNLSTNPGNIYIKDLFILTEYTNAYPYMFGNTDFVDLYISENDNCRTTGVHILDVGYYNSSGKIPLSKSPKDLRKEVIVKAPQGVTYTQEYIQDHYIRYTIKDTSKTLGPKNIIYTLKSDPSKIIILGYEAMKREKPEIRMNLEFFKNTPNIDNCIIVKGNNTCFNQIDFHLNGIDTTPIFSLKNSANHFDFNNKQNFVTESGQQAFHQAIINLPCGRYKMFAKIKDIQDYIWDEFEFVVKNPTYKFKVMVGTQTSDDDNQTDTDLYKFNYLQNKSNEARVLKIQRVDNITCLQNPEFTISTDTNYQNKTENTLSTINKGLQTATATFTNNQTRKFDISVKYPGLYHLNINETSDWIQQCPNKEDKRYIDIKPNHKQNHDVLFVRGEDSTSFEYEYVVAREGDNIQEPIHVSDIDIASSFNDIRLCVAQQEFFTGLSQIGVAKIKVTNKSKQTLKNIRVELNVLTTDDEGYDVVTLDEFFESDGIFRYLQDNFYTYNKQQKNNLEILNLPGSIDGDNIGEENVEILIKTLEYDEDEEIGDSIEINIPYMSKSNKTVKIQPLIFEEPFPLYTYENCDIPENPLEYFKLTVYDSILTDLSIEGKTDLLEINQNKYPCPNECFNTVLTYKITNIDSSETERISAKTKIINDNNLIPYKFEYQQDGNIIQYTDRNITNQNPITDDIKVQWSHDYIYKTKELSKSVINAEIHFPKHDKYTIQKRTNIKGEVTFYFNIPKTTDKTYTIKKLLKEAVTFKYKGDYNHQGSTLYINKNDKIINTLNQKNNKNQVYFEYEPTYKKYKSGDTVALTLSVTYKQKILDNTITFYPTIKKVGQSDYLTVYYRICNLSKTTRNEYNEPETKYNQGLLTTTFKTDDYQLIENQISKDIYAGLDTKLTPKVNIERRLIEQQEINIINIELLNEIRDNYNVECSIDLGPNPKELMGEYEIIDINIDDGNYNITQETDIQTNNTKVNIDWLIGEMKANSSTKAQIVLKGKEIGLSDIKINISDFLTGKDYHFGEKRCTCE